ncbi:hypothetical protein Ae201684P_010778 [Aphanomyces euteiches]|nr:hypothetical protein Ae201684P_010778 [Aphanomyces euteiches]
MCVAGVFLDHENDRITITQTGIALDKRFPFQDGENRTNGISWIVFQHVTDRLTLVRWSVLNFCPVNAKGALPLREVAQYMRDVHCIRMTLTKRFLQKSIAKPSACLRAWAVNFDSGAADSNWKQSR